MLNKCNTALRFWAAHVDGSDSIRLGVSFQQADGRGDTHLHKIVTRGDAERFARAILDACEARNA